MVKVSRLGNLRGDVVQAITLIGGDNTTTSRTITITCYADVTLSKITVPVILVDNTTVTKNMTITVTIGDYTVTEIVEYDATETGERTVECNVGYEVTEGSTVTIRASGSNCYIHYGTTSNYGVAGQMMVDNSFEAVLYVDVTVSWTINENNNGYPYIVGFTPSAEESEGYQDPKPLNSWKIDASNDGYPYIVPPDESEFIGYDDPKPLNSWKIDANNDGYPWTWGFTEIIAGQNIFFKTANGLIPLTAYYKTGSGLIPLTMKTKE